MKTGTKFWITFCSLGAIFGFSAYSAYGHVITLSAGVAHSIFLMFWVAIGVQEIKERNSKEGQ